MKRVALVFVIVAACGCRRHHTAPSYESDTTNAPTATQTPTPPERGTGTVSADNPLGEPVLPPHDDRPRMPDGGTLNGDPRGPRPVEWQKIVDDAMPALQGCFDRADLPPGEIPVAMHYTVELPGYTGAVTANGKAPKEVLDCCVKVIEALKFPEYRGSKVERDLSFTWSKRQLGRDAGARK